MMRVFVAIIMLAFSTPVLPCSIADDEDQSAEAWRAMPSHLEAIKEPRLWLVKFGKRTAMKKEGRHQTYDVEVLETLRGAAPSQKKMPLTIDMTDVCGDEGATSIDTASRAVLAHDGKGFATRRWHVGSQDTWVGRLRQLIATLVDDASYTKKLRATDRAMKAKDHQAVVTALQGFAGRGLLDAQRLDRLGLALGRLGRHAEAVLELDDARAHTRLLFRNELPLEPELYFRIRFNLLCYLSLSGRAEDAATRWVLEAFVDVLRNEKKPRRERWIKALKTDPDLASLRKTKEFAEALQAK